MLEDMLRRSLEEIGETLDDGRRVPFVTLDDDAYWERFKAVHGGDPLPYKNLLLFQDGWRYSSTDPAGPEYPPPKSEPDRLKLIKTYWRLRRWFVSGELRELEREADSLRNLQSMRSVPLQVQTIGKDEDDRDKVEVSDIDMRALEGRIQWLKGDIAECDRNLRETERSMGDSPTG